MIPFGTHVTARCHDGRFLGGRVIHMAKDASRYLVQWEDASPTWVEARYVSLERKVGPSLAQMARMFGVPDEPTEDDAAAPAPASPEGAGSSSSSEAEPSE